MKIFFWVLLAIAVLLTVAGIIADPHDPLQTALEEFLAHPDFAYLATANDGQQCAIIVYFAGPWAIEDRTDCGHPWAVTAR